MRLSFIGATGAAVIALGAVAAPNPTSGGPAPSDTGAGLPASHPAPTEMPATAYPRHRPAVVEHYVDLNSASRKELMTLPGIGAAEANKIIANRPYLVKTDLVAKNVLPVGPFLSLRHLVIAMPVTQPKGKH